MTQTEAELGIFKRYHAKRSEFDDMNIDDDDEFPFGDIV